MWIRIRAVTIECWIEGSAAFDPAFLFDCQIQLALFPLVLAIGASRCLHLPLSVWLRQMWFETLGRPPAQEYRLRLKRHRALFVIALSVAACEHAL